MTIGTRHEENCRKAFGYLGTNDREAHEALLAKLPAQKSVAVRYNPEKPEQASLSFGPSSFAYLPLIFGTIWTLMTFGFVFLFVFGNSSMQTLIDNIVVY